MNQTSGVSSFIDSPGSGMMCIRIVFAGMYCCSKFVCCPSSFITILRFVAVHTLILRYTVM